LGPGQIGIFTAALASRINLFERTTHGTCD